MCRAAASGVESQIGMQQEGHVVAMHVEITLVNIGGIGKSVQISNIGAVWIVHCFAILQIGHAEDVRQGFSVGELDGRVIKFTAHDEVDGRTIP